MDAEFPDVCVCVCVCVCACVCVCVCVTWPPYLGGVMQHHCSAQDLDHAVVIVGYSLQGM